MDAEDKSPDPVIEQAKEATRRERHSMSTLCRYSRTTSFLVECSRGFVSQDPTMWPVEHDLT